MSTSEVVQGSTEERLRMDAYYYSFTETGVPEIDRILSAVAHAGKAYHHTENWQEETHTPKGLRGNTPEMWIQNAANAAADAWKAAAPDLLTALRACADRMAIAAAHGEKLAIDEASLIAAVEAIAKVEGRS